MKQSNESIGIPNTKKLSFLGNWLFPYVLAGSAYALGTFTEFASSLRSSVMVWPLPDDIYGWLLLMFLLTAIWLLSEFLTITNRETIVIALQWDGLVSQMNAVLFSLVCGWCLGANRLEWWIIIPWMASLVDAALTSWLGINNAAQKPFLSKQGST